MCVRSTPYSVGGGRMWGSAEVEGSRPKGAGWWWWWAMTSGYLRVLLSQLASADKYQIDHGNAVFKSRSSSKSRERGA